MGQQIFRNEKGQFIGKTPYSNIGRIASPETRLKMSLSRKGKKLTDEHKQKLSASANRRNRDADYIFKLSETKKGSLNPMKNPEVRRKMSETRRKNFREGKIKINSLKGEKHPWFGRKHTEEEKNKMSVAQLGVLNHRFGKHLSEHAKNKLSKALKGRVFSEEHIRKLTNVTREKWKDAEHAKKMFKAFRMKPTSPERRLIQIIKDSDIPYKYVGDGKFWIENINPDFVQCNGKKICIEIFGDYWHDPSINSDVPYNRTEEGRMELLKEYGWDTLIIWTSDMGLMSDHEVITHIREFENNRGLLSTHGN